MLLKKLISGIAIFSILFFYNISNTQAQKNSSDGPSGIGLGIKLGSISGITIKKYLGGGKALEFIAGRAYYWGGRYNSYHYFYDHKHFDDGFYKGYKVYPYSFGNSLGFQLHYLIHKNIGSISGLTWYYGAGAQLRTASYRYYYFDGFRRIDDRIVDIGFGLDGVIGLEYTIKGAPLSIFADANVYMEIINNPFLFDGQSGIGIRYNFN